MPKRKHTDLDSPLPPQEISAKISNGVGSSDSNSTSGSYDGSVDVPPHKKQRRSVAFDDVHVFYFPRAQGFACVPSQGGTTLGMTDKHAYKEKYPLKHYRKLRKIVRRKKADVEETEENSFSIDSILEVSQDEIHQTDSEEDDTETDGFFLQPVPTKKRKSLLRLSGVKKLDMTEKDDCKELRGSREICGCDCAGVCRPETCSCASDGIQCQVDRQAYPCGCTKNGCQNPSGRIEFNPTKVRRHYIHTLKRLAMEREAELGGNNQASTPKPIKKGKHIKFDDEGNGQVVRP